MQTENLKKGGGKRDSENFSIIRFHSAAVSFLDLLVIKSSRKKTEVQNLEDKLPNFAVQKCF